MTRTRITVTTEVDLDVETGARWFAGLDDEQQVQFFKAVAKESESWPHIPDLQWCNVGRHLAQCECSSDGARELIRSLAGHMDYYTSHPEETENRP